MPRELTPSQSRAILAQDTEEIFLSCITIYGAGLGPFRIVNNTESITRVSGTFNPYPFEAEYPEDTDNPNTTVTVRLDNIDREVTRLIRNYSGIPKATVELITASEPDSIVIGPCDFSVLSSEYDELSISLSLGHEEDFLNQRVPAQTYTPTNSAGIFP